MSDSTPQIRFEQPSTEALDILTSLLALALKNKPMADFLENAFGIDLERALGNDAKLDEIEAKGLLGSIGNFLVNLGVIDPSDEAETLNLADQEELDIDTARGISAFMNLDGSAVNDALNRAMMAYVSRTEDIPLETLQKAYDDGGRMGREIAKEFGLKSEHVDPVEFDDTGNVINSAAESPPSDQVLNKPPQLD